MNVDLTISNYRCFQKPAKIAIRKGFTAFIGVNNSGKSSLLKFFFEFRSLLTKLSRPDNEIVAAIRGHAQSLSLSGVLDHQEVFSNTNDQDIEIEFAFTRDASDIQPVMTVRRLVITISRPNRRWLAKIYTFEGQLEIPSGVDVSVSGNSIWFEHTRKADLSPLVEVTTHLANSLYIGPFRNIINTGTKTDYFDIAVGQSFIQQWRQSKTGVSKQENEAAYRLTKDIEHIFEYPGLEINPVPDDSTLQLFIGGKSYKLHELGAGMAQFILVLANAAIKTPAYILIDEPELNLHPSLQLDFLTTLASYATEGVLFATHSIGLAQASADRIYSVRKISEGDCEVAEYEATPRLSEFLGELSYAGYKELGFDKILLVEGPSEVKVIQQFLRLYKTAHKIVLIHVGGDSLIHGSSAVELEEITRISPNVYALIDSEKDSPTTPLASNRQQFQRLCGAAGITCHVLERRATENYFTDSAIKQGAGSQYRQLGPYDSLEKTRPKWRKKENWRIARAMTLGDLAGTDLGDFLSSL